MAITPTPYPDGEVRQVGIETKEAWFSARTLTAITAHRHRLITKSSLDASSRHDFVLTIFGSPKIYHSGSQSAPAKPKLRFGSLAHIGALTAHSRTTGRITILYHGDGDITRRILSTPNQVSGTAARIAVFFA